MSSIDCSRETGLSSAGAQVLDSEAGTSRPAGQRDAKFASSNKNVEQILADVDSSEEIDSTTLPMNERFPDLDMDIE